MRSYRLLSLFLCSAVTLAYSVEKKPWTFFTYMAAANSLNEFAPLDITEMMRVGSNSTVNVVVYLTMFEEDGSKSTRLLYIEKGKALQVGEATVEDSGSVDTLEKALELAMTYYPADHYCIDLWNHGGGILNRDGTMTLRGVCYDDDTGSYLTDRDCLRALTYAKNTLNGGKKIDVVAIDACLMNMLEFAYTIGPCVDFFVGSEETIPGDGFEYARILNNFVRAVPTPRAFAQQLVQVYQQTYQGTPDYTLSAIDIALLQPIVDNFNNIMTALLQALKSTKARTVRNVIASSRAASPWFSDKAYIDLLTFYTALLANASKMGLTPSATLTLTNLLKKGQQLIAQAVIAAAASSSYKHIGGLSVYFPAYSIEASYPGLYWTEHNPVMLQFLQKYTSL